MTTVHSPPRIKKATATTTFSADGTTASEDIFTVTGAVRVHAFWGVVSTTIGANHTGGFIETDDATAQIELSEEATGITLSALAVGTLVSKTDLEDTALTIDDNAAGAITEPGATTQPLFFPFIVVKKTGAATVIRYTYTTTDSPTSGAITWTALWEPLSDDGNLS